MSRDDKGYDKNGLIAGEIELWRNRQWRVTNMHIECVDTRRARSTPYWIYLRDAFRPEGFAHVSGKTWVDQGLFLEAVTKAAALAVAGKMGRIDSLTMDLAASFFNGKAPANGAKVGTIEQAVDAFDELSALFTPAARDAENLLGSLGPLSWAALYTFVNDANDLTPLVERLVVAAMDHVTDKKMKEGANDLPF